MTKETDFELNRAANNYAAGPEVKGGHWSAAAFIAGAEWARAQWPITHQTAEEAGPSDMGLVLKKLEEVSIWCGALEGQANRIQRETQEAIGTLGEGMAEVLKTQKEILWLSKHPYHVVNDRVPMSTESLLAEFQSVRDHVVDVGQKVEAVISLVDDLDELIRSEDGEAEPLTAEEVEAFKEGVDEAYRPAVGMFGIGGDSSVVTPLRSTARADEPADRYITAKGDYEFRKPVTPTLRNVLQAIEDVRALAVDAGISFDFTISTEA